MQQHLTLVSYYSEYEIRGSINCRQMACERICCLRAIVHATQFLMHRHSVTQSPVRDVNSFTGHVFNFTKVLDSRVF